MIIRETTVHILDVCDSWMYKDCTIEGVRTLEEARAQSMALFDGCTFVPAPTPDPEEGL